MIKKYLQKFSELKSKIDYLYDKHGEYDLKNPKVLMGKIIGELHNNIQIENIHDAEFQVFSQFGDDGIIQYLVSKLDIPNKTFIEFGVENYTESNTRYLLVNNNWSGLVIDGEKKNIEFIKRDPVSFMHDLHAICAFVTRENINDLILDFLKKGYSSEIGILSIDIDGNDYWIWDEISVINPVITIMEYNAVFGKDHAWTIPYKPNFSRLTGHKSFQYWGASIKAFCRLGEKKGYSFVGCNSAGNNAYFVRNDKLGNVKTLTAEKGYVLSKFREDVDEHGERYNIFKRIDLIKGMEIFNVETESLEII